MSRYKNALTAIKDGHLFDWIGNNGHDFAKEELIRIIKELDYAISKSNTPAKLREIAIENLSDMWDEE